MMRQFFLFLSHRKALRRWMETARLSRRFTRRFVAGDTLDDELGVCRQLNQEGIWATLDHLGENVASAAEAAESRDSYIQAVEEIARRGLKATVSIKLTQFGLDLSTDLCEDNVRQLVSRAKSLGGFVEIDMESNEYVDRTLRIGRDMHAEFGAVRIVIQAYLYRSEADIDALCNEGVPVRLCKGAYKEPATVAFPGKSKVDRNYVKLTKVLLDRGAYPAIASHDERIIEETVRYAKEKGISPDRFEFQMLYGIRRDLHVRLVKQGYRMRLYVPYGTAWYPYFMRRLAERPANVFFLVRNLLHA